MESDEEFIIYGTPFPDLDDDAVLRKKTNNEVRDEKGRQRFHGAFTGGFSAGYFNTVGTKEGWTPSSFISSRTKRPSSHAEQNPEAFMDEEDFGEFGIAPKRIRTTSQFQDEASSNSAKQKSVSDPDAPIPGVPPLKDLIKPVVESIGVKILKKLGWKQGQGIGPRVKKKSEEDVKIYGCSLGPLAEQEAGDENYDLLLGMYTLAPEDIAAVPYTPKDNYHGLGYLGLSTKSILAAPVDEFSPVSTKSWLEKDKRKLRITGQAFGVGAFEDDDEDIYSKDDMSQYDFSDLAIPKSKETAENSSRTKITQDTFGKPVLEGFCLSTKSFTRKYYPPPVLPPDFKPVHKCSRFSVVRSENSRHQMTACDRSVLLGEKKFILSDNESEKSSNLMEKSGESEKVIINSAQDINSSFKPFAKDENKQKRYEEYLKLRLGNEFVKVSQPSSMTEWEKQQELEEFARVATFYQPVSKLLSSRFESRSQLSMEHDIIKSLQDIKKEKDENDAIEKQQHQITEVKRETFEWHPASLLCRRFNVPNPYPDSTSVGVPHVQKTEKSLFSCLFLEENISKPKSSSSAYNDPNMQTKVDTTESTPITPGKNSASRENVMPGSSLSDAKNETVVQETGRPPMDLFKDIFANTSSEDSASEHEDNKDTDAATLEKPTESTVCENVTREDEKKSVCAIKSADRVAPTKKAFGVFANLDLDALNKRPCDNANTSNIELTSTNIETKKIDLQNVNPHLHENESAGIVNDLIDLTNDNLDDNSFYGPAPPPSGAVAPSMSSALADHAKLLRKSHKHKHKHHRHKSKKQKKEKKKHSRKSDDSSSSDDEISAKFILEKIKKLEQKGKLPKM